MKKTLILGASLKPNRYSNLAIHRLVENNIETIGVGLKGGEVAGIEILTGKPKLNDIHTVTLYLNAKRQIDFYDYILSLTPNRVIFNPGTENPEFEKLLTKSDIEFEIACTLVLLSTGQY